MRRGRILVVEDDEALAFLYRTTLRFEGFDVDVAHDGLTALRCIERNRPDVIILDLHLPVLRGEGVMRELAGDEDLRRIPVIVVTGTDQASDMAQAMAQAKAIIRKPCPPEVIIAHVHHVIAA